MNQLNNNHTISNYPGRVIKGLFYSANYFLFISVLVFLLSDYSPYLRALKRASTHTDISSYFASIFFPDKSFGLVLFVYAIILISILVINFLVNRGWHINEEEKALFKRYSKVYSLLHLIFGLFSMFIPLLVIILIYYLYSFFRF